MYCIANKVTQTHSHITSITYVAVSSAVCDMQGRIQGGGAPPKIGKNIFWRKIVIFHTKYPKNFRASLSSAQFF